MGKETGFLEYGRHEPGYRPKDDRLKDYRAVELRLSDDELYRQAARCMDCGVPFCHGCGCPLSNIIPEFNDHVYHHRWKEALDLLIATNPFPEVTGRICPAPCEGSCVLGINDKPVAIRLVELAIIEKAFERGYIAPQPPANRRGERVAIVGSGPAGLAAADILNRSGFNVVVYENAKKAGGILRYGIPDFKLEKWVLDRRVDLMQKEGIVFEMGVEVGNDVSYRFLQSRFDALVLTGGAREPRDLKAPGRELDGIHFAMTYLVQQNRRNGGELCPGEKDILAGGKAVVVIGGGDTGSDCVGTALRQGAKSVMQFEILPKPPPERSPATPWPMWPDMLRESSSHKEGGARRWCVTTDSFEGADGKVTALNCAEVEWVASKDGRKTPRKIAGSEFRVEADLVLLAMGFVGPGRNLLVEELGLKMDPRGFIARDDNRMTSSSGIFVAGDMTQGASLVVRAIEDGKCTARGVAAYLNSRRNP
ncbi:MAG: glutamate synthase subunit beta [Lentisphaerae bacterium]|nr:glutamate synthase subunit beta [Lentisphaerota bacterium]